MKYATKVKMADRLQRRIASYMEDDLLVGVADKVIANEPLSATEVQVAVSHSKALRRLVEFKKGNTPMVIRQAVRAVEKKTGCEPMMIPTRASREPKNFRADGPNFYLSPAWRDLRYRAIVKSQGKCECCGRSRTDGVVLHVDHVKPISRFPALRLTLSNLQVLCADCNMGKGAWDQTDWRDREIDPRYGELTLVANNGRSVR
jgi:5-methylcytosine-specific restriction endonuclease McrA